MNYRTKPAIIQAIQFNGLASLNRMVNAWQKPFLDVADFDADEEKENFFIETLEGNHCANKGDWIIKGLLGEFYPCKPEAFEKKYEKVE